MSCAPPSFLLRICRCCGASLIPAYFCPVLPPPLKRVEKNNMSAIHGCVCPMCIPGACGGQKRTVNLLGLVLQMVGNHHVGSRNRVQALCYSHSTIEPSLQPHLAILKRGLCCEIGDYSSLTVCKYLTWFPQFRSGLKLETILLT